MSRYHSSNWVSGGMSSGGVFDEDNDSDTDSKVSGSLAVDKAWKAIQEKGYRKSSAFLDDDFAMNPIGNSHFNGSQDNGPLSGDHWENELMGAKTTSDVKSVTQLMTGQNQQTKPANIPQQTVTNGTHSNGYMPHKSPPLNSYANRKTPPGSHGKPSPMMQRRFDTNSGGYHARQRSAGDHPRQQYPAGGSNFTHHRTGSTPNQASHFSPRMQHKQYQQQHKPPTSQGLQRPLDAYHGSMQGGSTSYHTNTDHRATPTWGGHGERNTGGNSSGAHVVEVSTPDIKQPEDTGRRPSAPFTGRPNYPTSTTTRSIHDRRRSEDPALAQAHTRLQSYQHQVSHPLPHQAPLSPVSHSKSTEFPRVNGHFDGLGGLPPGIPTTTPAGSSLLPRSSSSGYVWSEQKALDRDAHHVKSQEKFSGPSSELPYRSYDGQSKSPHHDQMRRSGSIPRSEGSGSTQREPELSDVIDFLNSGDPNVMANAASYLQHLAYGDDAMKSRIREFGAIPVLINQLNYPEMKVQLAVLGALRNLSYGRLNDDNKIAIATDNGLPQLLHLLRVSRTAQVRELVTGILWNLSSCEELKLRIIKNSLNDIVTYVLIPYSGWSEEMTRNPAAQPSQIHWNAELRNSTGTLRNVSSAGEPARVFMRSCVGLVDALLWTINSAVKRNDDIDNKTIENSVCILRNLSYRLENEIDPQEGAENVLDIEWEKEQRRELEEDKKIINRSRRTQRRSWLTMCVRPNNGRAEEVSYNPSQFARRDTPLPHRHQPVFGIALLWQPEVVHPYLALIRASSNPDTLEAACGAIHNLTACSWKWASYIRNVVRNTKGLPAIIALIEANHDPVIRAATTALRNLAIDPRNKAIIGDQAMESLATRLPFGPRHIGLSDSTTIAILCALIELVTESPENARLFRSRGGVALAVKLARSKQHVPKIVFAANKLCSVLYDYKEGYSALKREGWDMSQYSRAAKETGHSFEFEPRSISKDFRASTRLKPNKKKREREYKSSTSLDERPGTELAPSPVPSTATTNLGMEHQSSPALDLDPNYDVVDSSKKKPTSQSVPNLGTMGTYSMIPDDNATSEADQQSGSNDATGRFDPNAVYAQVDKNKKRSTRKSGGRDDFTPMQHAPYPVDDAAGVDSWV